MLHVDEDPARREQLVDLRVDLLLACVGLVVNGEAGHHGVEGSERGDGVRPGRLAIVQAQNVHARGPVRKALARRVEHRLGEIEQHGERLGIAIQDRRREHAVAAAQIENPLNGPLARADEPQHDVDLRLGERDRTANAFEEGGG